MKKQIQINLVVLFLLFLATTAPAQNGTPHFGFQVGSSFSTMGNAGNMFTHSLAPVMNWDMNERFTLQVGTIFSTSRMNGLMPADSYLSGSQLFNHNAGNSFSSMTVYAFGAYQLNPRLTLTGGTWVEQSGFDFMGSTLESGNTFNPQGVMLGLDYKVTENFRFGFEVSTTRGYNPYAPFIYQQNAFPGGFNRNPFHR